MLLTTLYNLVFLLALACSVPKFLYQRVRYGKYRGSFQERLGWALPPHPKKNVPVFWFHAVSVGETRALSSLVREMKKRFPQSWIVISSVTATGKEEAKRSLSGADHFFFLPFDVSWIVGRVVRRLQPHALIICETDLWPNLLRQVKERGGKVGVVSAKISERSARRLQRFPLAQKLLLDPVDLFCVQNEQNLQRFQRLGVSGKRLLLTGNLKFDVKRSVLSEEEREQWQRLFSLDPSNWVICLGSTHAPEERELVSALTPLMKEREALKVLVVPRHPERFDGVEQELSQGPFPVCRLSEGVDAHARVILVDKMGVLRACYGVSQLSIVAGSFSSLVGGHNILEPLEMGGIPFFGPHMREQEELREVVLQGEAGVQLESRQLSHWVRKMMDGEKKKELESRGEELISTLRGSVEKTLQHITQLLES